MLHLLGQALFGLVVGAIAKLIFPGQDPGGWIVTMLLGLVGSMMGTFVGRALWGGADYSVGLDHVDPGDPHPPGHLPGGQEAPDDVDRPRRSLRPGPAEASGRPQRVHVGQDLADHPLELADLVPARQAQRDPLACRARNRRRLSTHSSGLPRAVHASMRARV